jgi:autotransporter-associated beta strand protein
MQLKSTVLPIGFAFAVLAAGAEVDLTPVTSADGEFTQVTVAGEQAWQNTGTSGYLYARRPDSFGFAAGQTLYVRVTYFDDAAGLIDLQYDSESNAYTSSPLHTRTSRVGSGRFVNGHFELPDVRFTKRQNGSSDFRIICGTTDGAKVPVRRITLSDTPFDDPDFQLAVARAWQSRYTGPAKDYVDTSTLKGKVMTGYQAWFNTPNDLRDGGWRHWVRNNTMTPENFTIDAWPDLREYDPAALVRAGNVMTASGEPAYLFSSATYSVVHQHFRWMRKHNIDGAWLQRFHPKAGTQTEWPLRNVSQAAAEEGLVWGVEYDVSGMADATVAANLQADWEWLTTRFDLLNDPRYIHEDGKPVVFIWGLAVPDRNFTTSSADAVVDYFHAQGVHLLGGLPTNWSTLDDSWQAHMAKYDGVLVWMNKRTQDAAIFRNRGQDFYPHIWPGFSWAHLKKLPATPLTQYTDRTKGQFYWSKGRDWINGGAADSLFFGMWDEYDESTHIMPMTDDPPPPHTEWGRFIRNQDQPGDWWMMLTDELKRMMLGQRANTNTLPTVDSLANRSNIGAEASVDLGETDLSASLSVVHNIGDGNTLVETVGGWECRGNAEPTSTHRYMYFNVNHDFAGQLTNGDVTIEVEYYDDTLSTVLGLQYDSSSAAYANHPKPVTTTGSNTWRRVRFEIADAFFGGRQNGGADFRLNFNGRKCNVNRLWVRLPEGKLHPFTWTNASSGPTLDWSQNANWLGGITGQSDLTSTVRFFPGQRMPGGTIAVSNNLTGLRLGALEFSGTASFSADTVVTLGGNGFSLGGTAPALTLDATKTAFGLTYDIAAPVTLLGKTQVDGGGDAALRISGPVGGPGGLHKTSAGTLTLSGTHTCLGNTTVDAGTFELAASGSLGFVLGTTSGANNSLTGAGTVILDGTFVIDTSAADALDSGTWILENVGALTGPYGPAFSVAGFNDAGGNRWTKDLSPTKTYTFDETTGVLTLEAAPVAAFFSWISGTFANGRIPLDQRGPNDDYDGDGIPNLIEYAIAGQDPTVASASIGSVTGGTLRFDKRQPLAADLTYAIQQSSDLGIADDWTEITGGTYVNDSGQISCEFSPGSPAKNFLRLQVLSD